MQFSQSRASSRGALIAVIKIQIDNEHSDRIFLHQNDDDYRLAQQFKEKHQLNSALITHIYERINMSRMSIMKQQNSNGISPSVQDVVYQQQTPKYKRIEQTPLKKNICDSSAAYFANGPSKLNREQSYSIYDKQKKYPSQSNFLDQQQRLNQSNKIIKTANSYQFFVTDEHQDFNVKKTVKEQTEIEDYIENNNYQQRNIDKQQETVKNQQRKNNDYPLQKYEVHNGRNRKQGQKQIQIPTNKKIYNSKPNTKRSSLSSKQSLSSKKELSFGSHKKIQQRHIKSFNPNQNSVDYSFYEEIDKPDQTKILRKNDIAQLLEFAKGKKISKSQLSRISKEVTNRLYNENKIKKQYLKTVKEKIKNQPNQQSLENCTHHPQINKVSSIIAQGRKQNLNLENHLIEQGKIKLMKRQESKNSKSKAEIQQYSFKPQVNAISQKLATDRSQTEKNKCCRHGQQQNKHIPQINNVSKELVKEKGDFYSRMKKCTQMKNKRNIQRIRERRIQQQKDYKSGQRLFKPKVVSKRQSSLNIGEYLYSLSKRNKEKIIMEQKPQINTNSSAIVQQMYIKRMGWLFAQLDSNQDGIISSKQICIDSILPEILQIIMPVLFEMEQMDIQLNLHDFRNAIRNLHTSLNSLQKSILYNYNQKFKHHS